MKHSYEMDDDELNTYSKWTGTPNQECARDALKTGLFPYRRPYVNQVSYADPLCRTLSL